MIKKKDRKPVVVETNKRKIVNTWWAEKWIANLNGYADFENRLARGRNYVRHGAVVHLEMNKGKIYSLVQGSRRTPYEVNVHISVIPEEKKREIEELFQKNFTGMEDLLSGEFPAELETALTDNRYGFFPRPDEIMVGCNCPDWAVMCKHVVATLYATALRLDENPLLFLELRGLDSKELVRGSAENKMRNLLKKEEIESDRIIERKRIPEIFHI